MPGSCSAAIRRTALTRRRGSVARQALADGRGPPGAGAGDRPGRAPRASGRWYAAGDVNAFFGLAVDNLTNLVVLAGLLVGVFGFPSDLVLYRIVPGTALGVLVGDLWYTWLARRLARETGRADVTAMPFGIDTPSLFGITFGVLGPMMLATRDPVLAWKVGMGVTIAMGVAKLALAFAGEWVRRIVPRAGLLGSIAGVSVLLIAFLPMLKIITDPLVGFLSLGLILVALVGRIALPGRIPGALAAVVVGSVVYAVEHWAGIAPAGSHALAVPGEWRLAVPGRPSRGSTRSERRGERCRSRCRSRSQPSSAASTTRRAPSPPATTTAPGTSC